ncbi:hypothetical protein BVRB_040710, partial [Beta vulgaris subsp. vulgaris]
ALICIRTVADHSNADHGYGFAYLMLKHLDVIALQTVQDAKANNPNSSDVKGQSHRRRQIQTRIVQV